MTITFDGPNGQTYERTLPNMEDAAVEAAKESIEAEIGQPLPTDPRTDFPSFEIVDADGEFVAGG